MFEKEAEERARKIEKSQTLGIYDNEEDLKYDEGYNSGEVAGYERGFVDGAEFGYKTANEWHYIKDGFPPEYTLLNIITFDKDKKRKVWVGEYKGGNGKYWSGYFNYLIDVPYAWKELVLPELK